MTRIFRSLLIAVVNAIQEFFAFATDNGESQVGDSVKLNDGMATSNYNWSAYPSDTEITGDYTQTGTIEKVKQIGDEFVYGMQEPEQDNKDVTINTGEIYYAYTNGSDESVYTTDDPISKGTFILENAQIIQTLSPETIVNNYGVISGFEAHHFTGGNYVLVTTPNYSNTQINSFDIMFFFKTGDTINTYERIIMDSTTQEVQNTFLIRMNNGSYEFITSPENGVAVISSPSTNTNYGIRATYDGTTVQTYSYDFLNNTWVASNSYQPSSVQFNSNTYSVGVRAQDFYDGCVFKGSVDLSKSYIEINNIKTTFGSFSTPSTLYENTGTTEFTPVALDLQPEFTITSDGISIDSVDYDRNSDNDSVKQITSNIETVDNTTINSVTVSSYIDTHYYAYTNGSNQSVYTVDNPIKDGDAWTQPALSADGTMGGDICAVETNITLYSGVSAYYGFDGNNSTTFHSASGSTVGYFTYYSPVPLKVTSIQFRNQTNNSERSSKGGTVYGSNDNTNWTTLAAYQHTDTSNQIWSIDLSSNNGFYKYYKVYSDGTNGGFYWVFEECTFTAVTNQNPSVLYDNSFEPIDPQPSFSYEKAGLKNGHVVGTLNKNDGVYSDFGSARNYIISNNKFNFLADTWEIVTKVKFNSIKRTLFMGSGYVNAETDYSISLGIDASGHICAYLTSLSYTWNIAAGTPSTRVVEENIFYYIKLYFTGTAYKVDVSTTGEFDGEDNYLDIPSTTKVYNADNCILWGINAYGFVPSENLDGELDMKGTYFNCDGVRTDFYNEVSDIIITSETPNVTYYRNLTNDLEQTVSVDATIQTFANVTTSNNDIAITDGSYHLFNLTVPTDMTSIIESSGISYQTNEMPLLLKSNTSVGFLLKDDNNAYYRNSWVMNKSYDLHYQQINFSYPSGATVTCKVNNVTTDLTPYVYAGDIVSWSCDNAGVVTTGTYTVKYNSVDGNIQTITIS